jgi:histidinol-phosphatase
VTTAQTEPRAWLRLAHEACDETDPVMLAAFRAAHEVSSKADGTLVTATDRAVEQRLRMRIRGAHPDHGLVGEEYGPEDADRPVRWYIDPIDGTNNFVRGVPIFATLLAMERDGVLVAALVSAPALGMRWEAVLGDGAHALQLGERRRLRVSDVDEVGRSHLLFGSVRGLRASGLMPGFDAVVARSWRDRGFGDFWGHMLVAEGAAEAMLEVGLAPWDIAAPMLIVREAGGLCTDLHGEARLSAPAHVSSNGRVHDHLLRSLTV